MVDNSIEVTESLSSSTNNDSNSSFVDLEDVFITNLWELHRTLNSLRGTMSDQELEEFHVRNRKLDTHFEHESINEPQLPPTCLVLKIAPKVPLVTIRWLIDKMKGKRFEGGGELIVMQPPYQNLDEGLTLHLAVSTLKLLEVAEELEIIKTDKNGQQREFTVAQIEDFLLEGMHIDDLLTEAERQTICRHELENIRAVADDKFIPGYPDYLLYEGKSIFHKCLKHEIIEVVYHLHDGEKLTKFRKWYLSFFSPQPIEEIREYFGESIALYFAFLGYYTSVLVVPVVLGLIQWLITSEAVPFFCVFNVVWVTLFLELWKKKSNELAFKWGTIGMTSMDEPRANFRGAMGIDAVTGKIQPQSARYMTYVKMYGVSIPIVFLCMVGAFIVMLMSFWAEDYIRSCDETYQQYIMLPSIIYSVLVLVMNAYYRRLATFLTEWENHRTQSQFDMHRVTKLVLFEFVNNFLSLFYIAFIIGNMDMLKSQLQTMLIISQAINNFQEAFLPLSMKYYTEKFKTLKHNINTKAKGPKIFRDNAGEALKEIPKTNLSNIGIPQLQIDDPRIKQAAIEGDMEEYQDTFDDYLELFVQFGYVFLFSSVYPMAAFWALLNNVLEIRADAYKLCKLFQRPVSRRVKNIGAWQRAFEVLGALSILTNCGLLYLCPQIRSTAPSLTDVEWLLLFVFLEHILLGLRYLLHIAISDKPEWVRVALAKRAYESKQALKFQRSQVGNKKLLTKYNTVHGSHPVKSSME